MAAPDILMRRLLPRHWPGASLCRIRVTRLAPAASISLPQERQDSDAVTVGGRDCWQDAVTELGRGLARQHHRWAAARPADGAPANTLSGANQNR